MKTGILLSLLLFTVVYSGIQGIPQVYGAQGDISDSVIDTIEYDGTKGDKASMINLGGDIYLVAAQGSGNQGIIYSVDINTDGSIDDAVIDTLVFDGTRAAHPDLIKIDANTVALAYRSGPSTGGPIDVKTFDVNADGTSITLVATQTSVIGTSDPNDWTKIFRVSGNIFGIIASLDTNNFGFIKTRQISDAGAIGAEIDSIQYDTTNQGRDAFVVNTSGDIFAIAYRGGFVGTVDINTDGTIDAASGTIDLLQYDTGRYPNILPISGDVYAIAEGAQGKISTVNINSDGSIDDSVIDTFQVSGAAGTQPHLVKVANDVYAMAYSNSGGYVTTVCINSAGVIGDSAIDTLNYNTDSGGHPVILQVSGDIFAISHTGLGNDGFIKTVDIETTGTACSVVTATSSKSIGESIGTAELPSFTKFLAPNEFPLSIQDTNYAYDDFSAKKTTTLNTGEPIQIKILASDDGGGSDIKRISLYMNLHGTNRELFQSNTAISYNNYGEPTMRNFEGIFDTVNVSVTPNGLKQYVTFDITFAKEMPLSDIIIQAVDEVNNSMQIRAVQAIQVTNPNIITEGLGQIITNENIESPPEIIPNWIKQRTKAWTTDSTSDEGFAQGLTGMINENILKIPNYRITAKDSSNISFEIPTYLKHNAKLWTNGIISESEFIDSLQYLLDNHHITIKA